MRFFLSGGALLSSIQIWPTQRAAAPDGGHVTFGEIARCNVICGYGSGWWIAESMDTDTARAIANAFGATFQNLSPRRALPPAKETL